MRFMSSNMGGGRAGHVERPWDTVLDRVSDEGRAASNSLDLLLPAPNEVAAQDRQGLRWGKKSDLKTSWVPGWILETTTFVKKDVFAMDMEDAEKLELLDEQHVKQTRSRKRKLALFMILPFLLLAIYGVFAIGSATEVPPGWRQNLLKFKSRGEHAERQTAREQYLVGVGKADVTG